jgi:hypothetical protein
MTATASTGRAVLLAPDILSPRKDRRLGRAQGRVARDGASATLDTDLATARPGAYQEDAPSTSPPLSLRRQDCRILPEGGKLSGETVLTRKTGKHWIYGRAHASCSHRNVRHAC